MILNAELSLGIVTRLKPKHPCEAWVYSQVFQSHTRLERHAMINSRVDMSQLRPLAHCLHCQGVNRYEWHSFNSCSATLKVDMPHNTKPWVLANTGGGGVVAGWQSTAVMLLQLPACKAPTPCFVYVTSLAHQHQHACACVGCAQRLMA